MKVGYKVSKSKAVQNLENLNKGQFSFPKWTIVIGSVAVLTSAAILVTTITIFVTKQRDGLYNETCATRTCSKGLGLKCINQTCLCLEKQFYREKCRNLSTYLEPCDLDNHCISNQLLICKDLNTCGCNSEQYWNSIIKKCVNRKSYNEACNGDECKNGLNLACNSKTCVCSNTEMQFWNGTYCTLKKSYNEGCVLTSQCLNSERTTCLNSLCICKTNEYFKATERKCLERVGELETCLFDSMCLSPMFCSIRFGCLCPKYHFYDPVSSTCTNQYLFNINCNRTRQCKDSTGLSCKNNKCLCDSPRYTWSSLSNKCQLTYSQTTCLNDQDCNDSENLICRAYDCNCPNTSIIGMCDCKRDLNIEEYWNGTSCVSSNTYGYSCTAEYQCKTLSELTTCVSGKCMCTSVYYWDGFKCEPKINFSEQCVATYQCLDSQLTRCDGSRCVCGPTQFFNGINCVQRVGEFVRCTNSSMCLTPMTCNSSQVCVCGSNEYFENTTSSCNPKRFNYFDCDKDLHCRNDLGLACRNKKCVCSSVNRTWSYLSQKCLLTYGQKFCTSTTDCNDSENLICSEDKCNCPSSSTTGMCDCPRRINNETFWDQTSCSPARVYGQICTANYQCQTMTQKTVCSGGFCKCANMSTEYFNGVECVAKKRNLETCTVDSQCLDSDLTSCNSTHCICSTRQYFSNAHQKCVSRVGELESCFTNDMCLLDMICNTTHCKCQGENYYENTTFQCKNQLSYNGYCYRDLECRIDQGLVCLNNRCVCSTRRLTWSTTHSKCLLSYDQNFCTIDSECNVDENLKCVTSPINLCNCPNPSLIGMCDCLRVSGSEEYWTGTICSSAKTYGQTCQYNYECQTLTQKTFCVNTRCVCSNLTLEFWSGSQCTPKRRHLEQCSDDSHCLGSDLTNCIDNLCQCGTGKYYHEIEQRCISRLTEFIPCVNDTMCFEAMTCQSFECKCPSDKYFLNSTLACHSKKSYNFDCVENKECSESKGLSCQNGKCLCSNPLKTWDSTASVQQCKLTYAQVGCSSDSDCNNAENLHCRNDGSSRCNCPSNKTGSICDCKRSSTYEEYWDGSMCTVAKTINMACNQTYECQTQKEFTICLNGLCQCGESGVFRTTKCLFCNPDEFYYDDNCYYFSNTSEVVKADKADDACDKRGSSNNKLPVIYSQGVLEFFQSKLSGTARYWIRKRDKKSGYNDEWRGTNNLRIIRSLCSYNYGDSEEYMNFNAGTGCFTNDLGNSDSILRNYACQRDITLPIQ